MTCDFCRQEQPDSQLRPLLRMIDDLGQRTIDPFLGKLCDHRAADNDYSATTAAVVVRVMAIGR